MQKIKILLLITIFASLWACDDYTESYLVPEASTVAKFTYISDNEDKVPATITFTSSSIIPEGNGAAFTYLWDFGDGTTSNEENPSHLYETEGVYNVTLTIETSRTKWSYPMTATIKLKEEMKGEVLFFENFDALTVFPETWKLVNVDGNTPDNPNYATMKDSAWIVVTSTIFESKVALGNSFYSPEAAADDWMITPKISLKQNSILSWDALSLTTSGSYPDSYQVYVSTSTQDVTGCKANGIVYRVNDEAWGADKGGLGIQSRNVNLQRFAGKDVYIAFRLMTPAPGGDRLAIDNIKVTEQ